MDQKSLEIKTVNQLKDICRQDPQRYHGFSKNSRKADLIKLLTPYSNTIPMPQTLQENSLQKSSYIH